MCVCVCVCVCVCACVRACVRACVCVCVCLGYAQFTTFYALHIDNAYLFDSQDNWNIHMIVVKDGKVTSIGSNGIEYFITCSWFYGFTTGFY